MTRYITTSPLDENCLPRHLCKRAQFAVLVTITVFLGLFVKHSSLQLLHQVFISSRERSFRPISISHGGKPIVMCSVIRY